MKLIILKWSISELLLIKLTMKKLMKTIRKKLLFRLISRESTLKIRFRQKEIKYVQSEMKRIYERKLEKVFLKIKEQPSLGTKFMALGAVITLSLSEALQSLGCEKKYADELTADILFPLYVDTIKRLSKKAKRRYKSPQNQMNYVLRNSAIDFALKGPNCLKISDEKKSEGSNSYIVRFDDTDDAFIMNIYRCMPLEDIVKVVGEENEIETFRNTWCTFDHPLATFITDDGWFDRSKCLAYGDSICDMRWFGIGFDRKTRELGLIKK
jgi:hypothetical protein